MARPIRCDHCGKEDELHGTYRQPPEGWLTLGQSTVTLKYWPDYGTKDLCSIACVVAFLTTCVAPSTPGSEETAQIPVESHAEAV